MKILAIDASTKSTGVAIFSEGALLGSSCITSASTDLYKRIHIMVNNIQTLVEQLSIGTIVMEEVIPDHTKNTNTFKALMYLQALLHIQLHDTHPEVKIELVYPGSWRSACGIKIGRGVKRESLKAADIAFANTTYGLNITNDDQADAICIGHAYLHPKNAASDDINWE